MILFQLFDNLASKAIQCLLSLIINFLFGRWRSKFRWPLFIIFRFHCRKEQHLLYNKSNWQLEVNVIYWTLILAESVRNIVRRSIPMPHPPVGGKPYSRAVQKFSSTICASSSPASLSWGGRMRERERERERKPNYKRHCHWVIIIARQV